MIAMPLKLLASRVHLWMRRCRLRAYDFRPAREADLDFIMAEVLEGAKRGHYHIGLLEPEGAYGLRFALQCVIQDGIMPRDPDHGLREFCLAKLLVYRCMTTDEQVGYLLVSEKYPGTFNTDLEIYNIGVRENRRGEGHGRRMVELIVARMSAGRKLYARCYLASNIMCQLLQDASFLIITTKPSGTRELELSNT
jgi:ribosomal protein S18 acetylase RimI-like enzyme